MNFPRYTLLFITCILGLVRAADGADLVRLGIISTDSSHSVRLTELINDPEAEGYVPGARVVAAYKGGSADIQHSWGRVEGFARELAEKHGVAILPTVAEVCRVSDAILLLSVDGRVHLELAREVIRHKKPLFVDKPMATSVGDAAEIFRLAREAGVPCFSASSYRFYPGMGRAVDAGVGEVRTVFSYGPAKTEPTHPGLFWYGIHPTEALFVALGAGCLSVTQTETPDGVVVTGLWKDGRMGILYGIRHGASPNGLVIFGSEGMKELKPKGTYTGLVRAIIRFFQTGVSPIPEEETLEIMAFMEAADESGRRGGGSVALEDIRRQARLARR